MGFGSLKQRFLMPLQRDAYLDRMQERVLEIALPKIRKENLRQVRPDLLLPLP